MNNYENDYPISEKLNYELSQSLHDNCFHSRRDSVYNLSNHSVVEFYYDFNGFLPESLFHRILTRAANWTLLKKGVDIDTAVKLYRRKARFYLDQYHDFVIEMSQLKHARIKVSISCGY